MKRNEDSRFQALILSAAVIGALAMPTPAFAQTALKLSPWLVFGGLQGAESSTYSYLGALKPFEGASLGEGAFHRTITSWLYYEYETTISGQKRMVKARAPGIETGLGRAWKQGATHVEMSLSVGVRDTDVEPAEADSSVRGVHWALIPQLALRHDVTGSMTAELLASYSVGPRDRYARARLVNTAVWPGWRLGGELSHQQGQTYRNVSAGLFAGKDLEGGVRFELGAGQTLSKEGDSDPYLSVAFSWLP